MEESLHADNQLDSSSRFDTIPACDGQTDGRTHDDSKYRASMASSGKTWKCLQLYFLHNQMNMKRVYECKLCEIMKSERNKNNYLDRIKREVML